MQKPRRVLFESQELLACHLDMNQREMFGPDQKMDGEVLEMESLCPGTEGVGGLELQPPRLGGGSDGVTGRWEKGVLSLG